MILLAIVIWTGIAQVEPLGREAVEGPRIAFDREEYDFGSIMQYEEQEAFILVKNAGDQPLVIQKITSSCGCALAERWKGMTLPPGEEKKLEVKLNGKRYFGKLKKNIKIYSNDPANKVATLRVLLEVKADYRLDHRSIRFENLRRSQVCKQSIQIKSFMKEPLKFENLSSSEASIKATFRAVAPGDEARGFTAYAMDVEVDGKKIPPDRNRINALIKFKTNAPTIKEDTMVVNISVIEDIVATPERVTFEQCRQGEKKEKTVTLHHATNVPFNVINIRVTSPFVSARAVRGKKGETKIMVTLSDKMISGVLRAEIRVFFDIGNGSALVIPVRGFILPRSKEDKGG